MRVRTGALAALLATFLLVLAPVAGAKKGPGNGNSGAAHACQHGGYRSLVGADGTTFRNTGKCVSFAAHGGFSTASLLRIFLTDTGDPAIPVACSDTFYSDGSHALVTGTTSPWIVDIRDSSFCTLGPSDPFPPAGVGLGNIDVTVTVA